MVPPSTGLSQSSTRAAPAFSAIIQDWILKAQTSRMIVAAIMIFFSLIDTFPIIHPLLILAPHGIGKTLLQTIGPILASLIKGQKTYLYVFRFAGMTADDPLHSLLTGGLRSGALPHQFHDQVRPHNPDDFLTNTSSRSATHFIVHIKTGADHRGISHPAMHLKR